MNNGTTYIPSQILSDGTELLRERSFTRWMSCDLLQAAADFCKNIGLVSIYSECAPDGLTRYLFWKPPEQARFEIRSGRTLDQFKAFDEINIAKGRALLSLHVSENAIHSAVWITPDHHDLAVSVLAAHGVTPARRNVAG